MKDMEDDGGRRWEGTQRGQNQNSHHKKLHGGQRLPLRLRFRGGRLRNRELLGTDGSRHIQLFIFLIIGDLDVQVFRVFLAFHLPIRPSFLEEEREEEVAPPPSCAKTAWEPPLPPSVVVASPYLDAGFFFLPRRLGRHHLGVRVVRRSVALPFLPHHRRDGTGGGGGRGVRRAEMGGAVGRGEGWGAMGSKVGG